MKQTYPLLAASCLGLGCFLPMNSTQAAGLTYPETKKIEQIDDYHGTEVDDPYRWLEDDVRESSDVEAWVKAQNEVTFNYLKQLDHRESIEARLTELWNYEKIGTPFKRGDWYYFWKNDGLQNQSVLYRQRTLQSDPELVVDPNTWSEDGTVALGSVSFSEDATHMAYSIQDGGSDWRTWRIMHLDTRRIL